MQRRYVKTWLLVDVVSSIPFDLVLQGPQDQDKVQGTRATKSLKFGKMIKVVKMIRLTKIFKGSHVVESLQDWMSLNRYLVRILLLQFQRFKVVTVVDCCDTGAITAYVSRSVRLVLVHPPAFLTLIKPSLTHVC